MDCTSQRDGVQQKMVERIWADWIFQIVSIRISVLFGPCLMREVNRFESDTGLSRERNIDRLRCRPAKFIMSEKTAKILVVDDERDVTELVGYHLRAQGWHVEELSDPTRILEVSRRFDPDLIILDVMMPEIDGLQICRLFKADPAFQDVPIILLTARAQEEDRILGFEIGADDYVCKPFSPRELTLRVQGLLRRREGKSEEATKQRVAGAVVLDEDRHEVRVDGEPVALTATEFRLLSLLMERQGRVQSREQLLVNVWNYDEEMETRTVDTHVRRLREKLGSAADIIETVRGVGYRVTDKG